MHRHIASLILFCVLAPAANAAPPQPITKLQSRQWPERVVTQRILRQFSAILRYQRFVAHDRPPPRLPLSDVWYWTKPYSGGMNGLCQADIVTFRFRPVGPLRGARTPTVVQGISASPSYRLVAPPAQFQPIYADPARLPQADADCAKLNPNDMNLSGDDAENIWKAAWLVGEIVRQVHANQNTSVVDCSRVVGECASLMAKLRVDQFVLVESCTADVSDYGCLFARLSDRSGLEVGLRILFKQKGDEAALVRVIPQEFVVIADERAD